jgi:Glycosyltransferase like family 2
MPGLTLGYILPLRCDGSCAGTAVHEELTRYLRSLSESAEVLVIDGSDAAAFHRHLTAWAGHVRHLRPDPDLRCRNGKVAGVLTGLRHARSERVVIADDDVRWDGATLRRAEALLDRAELVRPQNYYLPVPWQARWDTARSLVNRALGGDYPGTLVVRRSFLLDAGGYDGDVLFENLELIRTVRGAGGRELVPLDLYVRRRPPTVRHFLSQRVREAYDDFAVPARLAAALCVLPTSLWLAVRGRGGALLALAPAAVAVAEAGRRRAGGAEVFPALSSWMAPLWVAERAVCAWLALASRLTLGGCRYHGVVIRRAASSPRRLRTRRVLAARHA